VLYSFSFEPFPWTEHYSGQPEILKYLHHCAATYQLWEHIQLNTRITQAAWDEARGVWALTTAAGVQEEVQVLVLAQGAHTFTCVIIQRFLCVCCRVASAPHQAAQQRAHLAPPCALPTRRCHFCACATGPLSIPTIPDVPGLSRFEGPTLHTAAWDSSVQLAGKKVAVVGTGASAIQVIPHLQKAARELVVFQVN
jgi:cation diffusion facilitator CzcD-associated flavoprotein CzcO